MPRKEKVSRKTCQMLLEVKLKKTEKGPLNSHGDHWLPWRNQFWRVSGKEGN